MTSLATAAPAENGEAPDTANVEGPISNHSTVDVEANADSAQPSKKRFTTLQALYARASFELIRLDDGTLIARRWRMLKALDSMAHAEAFLRQVEGAR